MPPPPCCPLYSDLGTNDEGIPVDNTITVVFVGDVVGESALMHVAGVLPELKRQHDADVIVVNGENVWDGKGINEQE
ncbi:MAG: YmdB family metallophosphoesterase, partial [Candidatus Kapaibacterium sp.]